VQVGRITNRYQTKLDKLLSLFEQTNFIDDRKITKDFNHIIDNEDIKILADILHYSGTDSIERKKLEIEQEAWRTIDAMTENLREKFLKKSEELVQKNEELELQKEELDKRNEEIEFLKQQLENLRQKK
jgi:hypothetical protein